MTPAVNRRDVLKLIGAGPIGMTLGSEAAAGLTSSSPPEDAVEIATVADLQAIQDNLAGDYVLVSDIDASGVDFTPLGDDTVSFLGTFYGNGHTISGLTIDRPEKDSVGLFGVVGASGIVRNLGLEGADVLGKNEVGAIAGRVEGYVTGSGAAGTVDGKNDVGGLVGKQGKWGLVDNSTASASVTGEDRVGGLVGHSRTVVSESSATGDVSGISDVGGLVGRGTEIHDCRATGRVDGDLKDTSSDDIGGLAGSATRISESRAEGPVTGHGKVGGLAGGGTAVESTAIGKVVGNTNVGGLLGGGRALDSTAKGAVEAKRIEPEDDPGTKLDGRRAGGLVGNGDAEKSKASGPVTVEGDIAGGLVGKAGMGGLVSGSYATGDVITKPRKEDEDDETVAAGGLVGDNQGTVTECYATGSATADWTVGGLVGDNGGTISDSYASGPVTVSTDNGGGLVGRNLGKIKRSYATGTVDHEPEVDFKGGLVGRTGDGDDIEVVDSYWDMKTTGLDNAIGNGGGTRLSGLQTSAMQGSSAETNMPALDFADTWETVTDPADYPSLAWNTRLIWRFWTGEQSSSVRASPTVVDGTVFIGTHHPNGVRPYVYAVDAETGESEWTFEMKPGGERASGSELSGAYVGKPSANVVDGTAYIKFQGRKQIVALDATTGEEEWRSATEFTQNEGSPTAYGDTVFTSDGEWLYWFDAETGTRERRVRVSNPGTSVTVVDDLVYSLSQGLEFGDPILDGVVAREVETGDKKWEFTTSDEVPRGVPQTVADGTLYFATEAGTLYALDAATGEKVWEHGMTHDGDSVRPRSALTVAGGTVYLSVTPGGVYAVDTESGELAWKKDIKAVSSAPTVVEDTVFVGGFDHEFGRLEAEHLYALDEQTGDVKWTAEADAAVRSSPTVVDGVAYFGTGEGYLYAVDADVEGSSEDSRVNLGTLGHHNEWARQEDCVARAVAGDDATIDLTEIQDAINWWAEDSEVPNTGGKKISLTKIQSLINAWAEDSEVSCR